MQHLRLDQRLLVTPAASRRIDIALALLGALAGAYVFGLALRYLQAPGYFDHVEPLVAALSWNFLAGEPLYQPLSAAGYRLNLHGPLLQLIEAGLFRLAGPSLAASKLAPLTAAMLALLLFALHQGRRAGPAAFGLGATLFAAYLLLTAPIGFWNRPDPLLLLIATLAVILAGRREESRPSMSAYLFIGALAGLAASLKLYAPIFLLPALARLLAREANPPRFLGRLLLAGLPAMFLFTLPFLHPQIEASIFLETLRKITGGRTRGWAEILPVLKFALYFLLPPLLLMPIGRLASKACPPAADILAGLALLAAMLLALFPASMPGAGPSHLLPLLPAALDLLLRRAEALDALGGKWRLAAIAYPLALALFCLPSHARHLRRLADVERPEYNQAVQSILARHPTASLELGYGNNPDTYRRSGSVRALLAFAGQQARLEPVTLMETQASGIGVFAQAWAAIEACRTRLWLLPAGEPPFQLTNYYLPGQAFVPPGFAQAFQERYRPIERIGPFDLWACAEG